MAVDDERGPGPLDDDVDALAAEYVIGALDRGERHAVETRMLREPVMAAAVAAWVERLSPLDADAGELAPPDRVWGAIAARIGGDVGVGR